MSEARSSHAGRRGWWAVCLAAALVGSALFVLPAGGATKEAATSTTCADPSGSVNVGLSYFGNLEQQLEGINEEQAALTPAAQAIIDNYKAGIAALNAEGGLAGCQVKPVIHNFPAQSQDFNQTTSTECAAFTQDAKVVAVFTAAYETRVALDCFAKAKTPLFQMGGVYAPTCADYEKYAGYLYSPDGLASCRYSNFVPLWDKAGLFPKGAKVGIVVFDDGSGQGKFIADKVYTPALKKIGVPTTSFSFPGVLNTVSGGDASQVAIKNGVLKFKAEGVNVVLFTPSGSQASSFFIPPAAAQGFFPSYGLASFDGLNIVQAVGSDTLKKAVAVSWLFSNLPLSDQQALPTNSAVEKCAAWSQPSQTTLTGSSTYCDFLNILQAAFKGQKDTSPASLKKGIEALGTSFTSSMTYDGATKFGAGDYDGVTVGQVLVWDPTTKTFVYAKKGQKAVTIP
ncbi:MAG TPA: hypothetical protein VFZ17_03440 [Acidimicrobiia bacterium]|nr:hypothetical protein [Acidimicrobiia bacterium]